MLEQVYFIKQIDVRHFKVDHGGQRHHTKRQKLIEIMHVSAIKQLQDARLDQVLLLERICDFGDDVLDDAGVYVQLDLTRKIENNEVVRIFNSIFVVGLRS